jgi:protoporphyrinogen oxidase
MPGPSFSTAVAHACQHQIEPDIIEHDGLYLTNFLIVGAGAAGLMTARLLARAGKGVTIFEARDRCGGCVYSLPTQEFGYPAEGGAEFVHGAAPVTRALMREARLSLLPRAGTRWSTRRPAAALITYTRSARKMTSSTSWVMKKSSGEFRTTDAAGISASPAASGNRERQTARPSTAFRDG